MAVLRKSEKRFFFFKDTYRAEIIPTNTLTKFYVLLESQLVELRIKMHRIPQALYSKNINTSLVQV